MATSVFEVCVAKVEDPLPAQMPRKRPSKRLPQDWGELSGNDRYWPGLAHMG